MNNRPTSPLLRALDALIEGRAGSWVINLVVIPVMFLLVLVLPPLSLPQRVLSAGYSGVAPKTGGTVAIQDGTYFSIPAGATRTDSSIKLNSIAQNQFVKSAVVKTLPPTLDIKSPAYQPSLQGKMPALAILSMPIPYDIDPLTSMDVYAYNGKKWYKLAFQPYIDETRIEAYITVEIPESVVIVQTQPQAPAISADLGKGTLPQPATPLLAEVNPVGLTIADAGGIAGNLPSVPEASASSPYQVLPTISNWDGAQYRGDIVDEMITTPDLSKQHIQALVDLAVEKLYPGINIDYQGVNDDNRADYTKFVRDLSNALHAKEKLLSVTVAMPVQRSADEWYTGSYDWDAVGHAADIVRIPMPTNKQDYAGDPSPVTQYMQWAVGRVDRYKLQATFSVQGRDEFGKSFASVSFANAVKLMGPIDAPATILPDSKAPLDMPKLRENGGIKFDAPSGLYSFTYKDDKGQSHTVWLETASSLAKKIALASQFNVRGVSLRDVSSDDIDQRVWDVLKQYRESKTPTAKGNLSIAWLANGKIVGKAPATDPRYTWQAPSQSGDVKIESALSFDDGQTTVAMLASAASQVAKAQPTPEPTKPPSVAVAPAATKAPGTGPAVGAPVGGTFRGRNDFGYGMQVNGGNPAGEAVDIKGMGFGWVKIQMPWKDVESGKGNYNWSSFDNFVNTMGGSGVKVLLSIVKAPEWSRRQYGNPGEGPPDNMQDAADFMGAAAARYCGKAGAIEVWNEENLDVEWHDKRGLSAPLYMDMLKRSFASIKAACPSMIVLSGAPTPVGGESATAIDDVAWLTRLYQNGLSSAADGVGAHPSGFRSSPLSTMATPGAIQAYADHRSFFFQETMKAYRAVMVQFGDGNKQVWATEFGWPVGTGGGAHPAGQFNNATDVANYYAQAYQWAKTQGWVGVMFAWQWDFGRGGEVGAFAIQGSPTESSLRNMPK